MARQARIRGNTGIYHLMVRGINKSDIFVDNADRLKYLDSLSRMNTEGEYSLYGYCLMSNHVHLLMREELDPLDRTMKRIGVSYSYYFNKKYERVGHLFQDRFRSERIETDNSLLNCLKYIHNNPVKANITSRPNDYKWSSYNTYIGKEEDEMLDIDFVLELFSEDRNQARNKLVEYTQVNYLSHYEEFIDLEEKKRLDIDPIEVIDNIMNKYDLNLKDFKNLKDRKIRNKIIVEIKNNTNSSTRELSKLIRLSKDMINRAGNLKKLRQENRPRVAGFLFFFVLLSRIYCDYIFFLVCVSYFYFFYIIKAV